MSSFAGNLREALGAYQPGDQDEINIKVKPMIQPATATTQELGSNPQLPSAQTSISGGQGGTAATPRALPLSGTEGGIGGTTAPAFTSANPSGLTGGPLQLSTAAPLGSQTDAIYEAAVAQLAQSTQAKNLEYLRELGYLDPTTGQIIPGTLETEAVRQRYDLNRQMQEAQREVEEAATRGNTVFSGRRAQLQGLASDPYYQKLANVETDLASAMAAGLQNITNLQSGFTVDRNVLIAEAAERARVRALEQQQAAAAAAAAAGGGGGGGYEDPLASGGSPEDIARAEAEAAAAAAAAAMNIPTQPAQDPFAFTPDPNYPNWYYYQGLQR